MASNSKFYLSWMNKKNHWPIHGCLVFCCPTCTGFPVGERTSRFVRCFVDPTRRRRPSSQGWRVLSWLKGGGDFCFGSKKVGLDGGFKYFLFSSLLGEMIQFGSYFSVGLVQPPTSGNFWKPLPNMSLSASIRLVPWISWGSPDPLMKVGKTKWFFP